jgi:hypothetical protein
LKHQPSDLTNVLRRPVEITCSKRLFTGREFR